MNLLSTKSFLLLSCLVICFVRGLFLSFIRDDSTTDWLITFTFTGLILHLFKRWFVMDAQERLISEQLATWRYNFLRDALLFPLYFRRTRGANAVRSTLWCSVFLLLCVGLIVGGGMVGLALNLGSKRRIEDSLYKRRYSPLFLVVVWAYWVRELSQRLDAGFR